MTYTPVPLCSGVAVRGFRLEDESQAFRGEDVLLLVSNDDQDLQESCACDDHCVPADLPFVAFATQGDSSFKVTQHGGVLSRVRVMVRHFEHQPVDDLVNLGEFSFRLSSEHTDPFCQGSLYTQYLLRGPYSSGSNGGSGAIVVGGPSLRRT